MRALATAATRTATACSWLRARRRRRARRRDGATRLPRRQARHRFLQPGRLLTHIGPGGWYTDTVIMGSHLKVNPKSTAGIPRPPRAAPSPRRSKRDCRSRSPNLSLAAGADHLPEYPHRFGQGFRVRRVLRAEERTHRPRWRAAAGRVPGQGRHLEALCAGGPGAHAGRTRQGRLQRRHHQHVGHGRHPGAPGTGRLGQGQRAGQRLRLGGIWLQPGRRAARNGAGQPGVRINW